MWSDPNSVRSPKHIGIPNFIEIFQKLHPVRWIQENKRQSDKQAQIGIRRGGCISSFSVRCLMCPCTKSAVGYKK